MPNVSSPNNELDCHKSMIGLLVDRGSGLQQASGYPHNTHSTCKLHGYETT